LIKGFNLPANKAARLQVKEVANLSPGNLPNELGTTRVVISRILKQFELDKIVELRRGLIKIS